MLKGSTKNRDQKFTRPYDTFIPSSSVQPLPTAIVVKDVLKLLELTLLTKAEATGNKGEAISVSLCSTKRILILWMLWEYWQEH